MLNNHVQAEIQHAGILGMHWGVHKAKVATNVTRAKSISPKHADKEWAKKGKQRAMAKEAMSKLENTKQFQEDVRAIVNTLGRIPGITQKQFSESAQLSIAGHIDSLWKKDKSMYSPSGKKRMSMRAVYSGDAVYMSPKVVKVKTLEHSEIENEDDIFEETDLLFQIDKEGHITESEADSENKAVEHSGILGMRWGVRRSALLSSVSSKKTSEKAADNKIKAARRSDVKNRRKLSDAELISKIGRLEKEKKLKELTDSEINSGKKEAADIMKSVGAKVATTVIAGATLYAIKAVLTGKVDINELAGYVTPKPGKK